MYAELINKTWARFKSGQEKFQMLTSLLPVVVFVALLDIIPIQWDAVRWIDLLLVLVIIGPTIAMIFVAIRADKIYLSIKARELSETLAKYQRWESRSKNCEAQAKKELIRLGLYKPKKK